MRRRFLPLLAALALALTGCSTITNNTSVHRIGSEPYTKGSGKTASVNRNLDAFTSVSVETGLAVFLSHGSASSAKVTADDNLTGMIKTDVSGGKLRIWVDGNLETHNDLRIDVVAASTIEALAADSGSSIDVEDLAVESLTVSVDSGSNVRAGGHATSITVSASSGSNADLRNVEANAVSATVDSGSNANVNVKQSITGTCSNGSNLRVKGNPASRSVDKDTSSNISYD